MELTVKQLDDYRALYRKIHGTDISRNAVQERLDRSIELAAHLVGVEEFELKDLDISEASSSLELYEAIESLPAKVHASNSSDKEIIADAERKLDFSERFLLHEKDIVGDPSMGHISELELHDLRDLRHRVIRTHVEVEKLIEDVVSMSVLSKVIASITLDDYFSIKKHSEILFDQMSFRDKVSAARKLDLIDPGLKKRLDAVNTVRNKFAHNNVEALIAYVRHLNEKANLLRVLLTTRTELHALSHKLNDPIVKKFG